MLRLPWKDEYSQSHPDVIFCSYARVWEVGVWIYNLANEFGYDVNTPAFELKVWDGYVSYEVKFPTLDAAKRHAEVHLYGKLMEALALFMPNSEVRDGD